MVQHLESFKEQYEVLQSVNPSFNKVFKQNTKLEILVVWMVRANNQEREEVLLDGSDVVVQER
jgi:hypothetical protein